MDLSTTYLGLKLRSPLVVASSPLQKDIANIKKMEENGAGAVVLHSLFEEQLRADAAELEQRLAEQEDSFAEAQSYLPQISPFKLGPVEYLKHIREAKEAVSIPIIASLNGSTGEGWVDYAKQIAEAGADALELNIFHVPTELETPGTAIEEGYVEIVRSVKEAVDIPIAVKLSPYFSSLPSIAKKMVDAGADGLVFFNRFLQPDIELRTGDVKSASILSARSDSRLPLRWIGLLSERVEADFAATGGIHTAQDVAKMLLVGAKVTMVCSLLLRKGIPSLLSLDFDLKDWMKAAEYSSVDELRGSMSYSKVADPGAFERGQYIRAIGSYQVG